MQKLTDLQHQLEELQSENKTLGESLSKQTEKTEACSWNDETVVCPCGQVLDSYYVTGIHMAIKHGASYSAHILAGFLWESKREICQLIISDFQVLWKILKSLKKENEEKEVKKEKKEEKKKEEEREKNSIDLEVCSRKGKIIDADSDDDSGEEEGEKSPIMFKKGTISQGVQAVLMMVMISPMEVYLCSAEKFSELEMRMIEWEEAAAKADAITAVAKGYPVLACDDGTWYRAVVTQMLPNNMVQVELVDVADCSTLHVTKLKKASADVMKGEVMAVSCCFESWVNEDRVMAKEKWKSSGGSLVEHYEEMQVDVVGEVQGQLIVRAPELEEKLKKLA